MRRRHPQMRSGTEPHSHIVPPQPATPGSDRPSPACREPAPKDSSTVGAALVGFARPRATEDFHPAPLAGRGLADLGSAAANCAVAPPERNPRANADIGGSAVL